MLSFQRRQEAFLFSFIACVALFACVVGLFSCFLVFPENKSGQSMKAAIHYYEKAQEYRAHNVYGLYQLSEKNALDAVTINPFQSENWKSLSQVLLTMGKEKEALKALKIAYMFHDQEEQKVLSDMNYQVSMSQKDIYSE